MKRIRAVFFDAGATLVHPDPPVEAIYAREFAADGARFTDEDLTRALTRAWEEVHANPETNRYGGVRGEPDFWQAFLNRVRSFLDGGIVSAAAFARLATHFRTPASWAVYGDVLSTLEELSRRDLKLAVVSNWDSFLPKLLAALDLERFFPVVAVSAIEETGKPDPEIFHRACRRVGVEPREALHVGDSVAEDLDGARGAGLAALLLDRSDAHPEIADRITSLAELPGRV
ncbi:MAG TPA: HAD-IA family hydrolase [Thermoanaerobaculia bacterium]|nr:HAD-IA family hydrolase [Thermoanaerobaculia bacterium]